MVRLVVFRMVVLARVGRLPEGLPAVSQEVEETVLEARDLDLARGVALRVFQHRAFTFMLLPELLQYLLLQRFRLNEAGALGLQGERCREPPVEVVRYTRFLLVLPLLELKQIFIGLALDHARGVILAGSCVLLHHRLQLLAGSWGHEARLLRLHLNLERGVAHAHALTVVEHRRRGSILLPWRRRRRHRERGRAVVARRRQVLVLALVLALVLVLVLVGRDLLLRGSLD